MVNLMKAQVIQAKCQRTTLAPVEQKMNTMAAALEKQGYKVMKQVLTENGKVVKQP